MFQAEEKLFISQQTSQWINTGLKAIISFQVSCELPIELEDLNKKSKIYLTELVFLRIWMTSQRVLLIRLFTFSGFKALDSKLTEPSRLLAAQLSTANARTFFSTLQKLWSKKKFFLSALAIFRWRPVLTERTISICWMLEKFNFGIENQFLVQNGSNLRARQLGRDHHW